MLGRCLLKTIKMKSTFLLTTILSFTTVHLFLDSPSIAQDDNFDVPCIGFLERKYENGNVYTVIENCKFSKDVVRECESINPNSIYAQCNIFDLKINSLQARFDDNDTEYVSVLFKYSESNSCIDGSNDMLFSKCDTFASYLQFLRNSESNKCHAFVSSALLGVQPIAQSKRNSPNRRISKVEIPGNTGRIIFTPSDGNSFLDQVNSRVLMTSDNSRDVLRPGQAISPLSVMRLVSPETMTTPANLKSNPAKIRVTRGKGGRGDYLDFSLGRKEENALNKVLVACK